MARISVQTLLLWVSSTLLLTQVHSTDLGPEGAVDAGATVCYGELGCFSILPPFAPNMPLPMPPQKISTKLRLYNRPNTTIAQHITADKSTILRSTFDPAKQTKILIHGFAGLGNEVGTWVEKMIEIILENDDANVIMVNWVGGAAVAYDQAVTNTRVVGAQIAHLIRTLIKDVGADAKNFHLIGFSLGAHVAAFAGKDLLKNSNKHHKLGRITGLDPANPGFDSDNPEVRLDKDDAQFVDAVHTDTKTLLVIASGMNRNVGHADFYPNGGASQPGCSTWNSDASLVSAVTDMTVCDHLRAPQLFMNSINRTAECNFAAYRCDSYEKFKGGRCIRCSGRKPGKKTGGGVRCNEMGYWAKPPATKKQLQYYLQTSSAAPFCARHYRLQLHWRRGPGSSKTGFRATLYVTLHGKNGDTKEFALNDGVTSTVVPGNTTRFLVSQDCTKDIGMVERVTFRWERPTCWTYFFCPKENVYLKRIKIIDAMTQKRSVYFPLGTDHSGDSRKNVIEVGASAGQEFFKKSFIRSRHPELIKVRAPRKNAVVPELVSVLPEGQEAAGGFTNGRFVSRVSKHKRAPLTNPNTSERFSKDKPQAGAPQST